MNEFNTKQLEIEEVSTKNIYFSIIESLLFVAGESLKLTEIANILECSIGFTRELTNELRAKYEEEQRGIKIIVTNDEYQFVTKSCNSEYVQKLLKTSIRQSLSQASIETLAIIAYKQPITRVEIEEIRGVKSDRAIYTLSDKKLIKETGRKNVPGRPIIYATTDEFLKHFDFQSLNEMPSLEEINKEKVQQNIDSNQTE
ncbi:segregation/condensation protein B [Clostridium sp. CM028]|uniref:SMC-Scp complex subunit ScpB n=1 Tax=Clostridium TaxID=1485 RepID=UPI0013EED907|nr:MULTISPECIES: SMC-Scp complex subunit ScpB [Clostridium]MBW9144164.1 segregation/condensation protein B [Clostridium sp. CM027]MBW9147525.1 segregation/condensation protein B [Clostridium sp. CM028]MBZ9608370.1 segregation/condensation protein B [Clostridium estertheticum]UVE41193.1 segregation/condensation protein B [Clostridium sp. CM027]WLC61861.1 segregation/condensation protein B [Clostridium sp. CM028]